MKSRMANRSRGVALLVAGAALGACSDNALPTAVPAPSARLSTSAAGDASGIPIYGLGGFRRATPQSPCATGKFRDFDYWVGDWKVYNIAGAFVATNHIVTALDGCVVEENWAPLNGRRGRSLSSYDAETGMWRQTWVPENFGPAGRPLRLAGNLDANGEMLMVGVRTQWGSGAEWINTFHWLKDGADVVQFNALDIPAFHLHIEGAPRYVRTTDPLPPTTSPGTPACMPGGDAAENRNLDFTVGNWTLAAANGLSIGASSIVIDPTLSGCLIEESFSTPKGYQAIGWLYYDAIENVYYRTYVDSEGERVELKGTYENGRLTMEGAEPVPGANGGRVRMTWTTLSDTQLQQTWEVSRDDGTSWRQVQQITFTRS